MILFLDFDGVPLRPWRAIMETCDQPQDVSF